MDLKSEGERSVWWRVLRGWRVVVVVAVREAEAELYWKVLDSLMRSALRRCPVLMRQVKAPSVAAFLVVEWGL